MVDQKSEGSFHLGLRRAWLLPARLVEWANRSEGRGDHCRGVSLLCLLHDFLASDLKGDSKTDLSGLL